MYKKMFVIFMIDPVLQYLCDGHFCLLCISAVPSCDASTVAVSSPGPSLPVISASPSHDALTVAVSSYAPFNTGQFWNIPVDVTPFRY